MSRLVWNAPGDNRFHSGLDRGVLYAVHERGRAWNGLVSVDEDTEGGTNEGHYLDGIKYANRVTPDEYMASIEAFTYPDQFEQALGYTGSNGLTIGNQIRRPFSFSYRTSSGSDLDHSGSDYQIHIIYNATIVDKPMLRTTVEDTIGPETFKWSITTKPPVVDGFRPTSHWIVDSRYTDSRLLETIEATLWGGEHGNAWLIPAQELIDLYREWYPTGYGYGLYGRTNGYGHGTEHDFLG